MKKFHDRRARGKAPFRVGDEVFIRNYLNHGDKWIPGIVLERCGDQSYTVHHGGQRKVHTDYMKKKSTHWEKVEDWVLVRKQERQRNLLPNPNGSPPLRRSTRDRKAPKRYGIDDGIGQKKG